MANLCLDHNVSLEIARLLRPLAKDIGLDRAGDDEVLLSAAQQGRILVSHNYKDFRLLHNAWRRWSTAWGVARAHTGILIVAQLPPVWHERIADELNDFIGKGQPLANELWHWRPASGWQRRL